MADADARQRRKLAYYRALTSEAPAFALSLTALCRELDGILAPYDRNTVRWELLDATHGGEPADQIAAYREIVAQCEEAARAATGPEAARWRDQAELPRRFADLLEAVAAFRQRWRLPRDGVIDLVSAYLSGEERLVPPEPAVQVAQDVVIQLEPPDSRFFDDQLSQPGDLRGAPLPPWALPYDLTAPPAARRQALETRLARLFALLREQALAEAARLDAAQLDAGSADALERPDAQADPLQHDAHRLVVALHHAPEVGAHGETLTPEQEATVRAWVDDLGIPYDPA